jgi:type I restriction enzyme S subunit
MENGKGAVVHSLLNNYGAGSTEFIVLRPLPETIISKYLYYFMQQKTFRLNCQQNMTGSAGQKRVPIKYLERYTIPVPPLPEQERIVAKIEELFSQLDAAVAELKSVKEKLVIYRQSVLKEAFSFENAQLVEISSIVDNIKIGPFGTMLHKSDYVQGGIPVINPQHIKNNTIVESSAIAISETKAKELENCKLQVNDVIMGRRGEMGRTAPVTMRENGWICGTGSIMIRLKKEYDAILYSKILASPQVVHFLEKMAKGTTMKNLNEKIVARIPVPKITRDMQDSILSNTSRKMSICDNIERTVDTALQQAAALRQSILKQAFEGNL